MQSGRQTDRRKQLSELGRLLAAADGYRVLTPSGRRLGRIAHVRYREHADWPDEIVVRSRSLLGIRRRAYPLEAIDRVDPQADTVTLAPARPHPPGLEEAEG